MQDEAATDVIGSDRVSPWDPAFRRLTIGILMNVVTVAFGALAISAVMPLVSADLGGQDQYGWVFSAYLLANLVGIVAAGIDADRRGPGGPFTWGVALFAIGLVLAGLAQNMEWLIGARVVQGLGGGGLASIGYVVIGRAYGDAARPKMLALLSTGWVIPGLVGPALAGIIGEVIGWRAVFLGLVPIPLIAAMLALPPLRGLGGGTVPEGARRKMGLAIALAVGTGLLLSGLGKIDELVGIGLVIAGLVIGMPALARLMPRGTLIAAAGLPAAVLTQLLLNLGMTGADTFTPLTLVDVRGTSVVFASLSLTMVSVTWTMGSWIQARYSLILSRRRLITIGLLVATLAPVGMLLVTTEALPPWAAAAAWGIGGLGIGLAFSTLTLVVLEAASEGAEGAAAAGIQLANQIGSGLGAGIVGAIVAVSGSRGNGLERGLVVSFGVMAAVLLFAVVTAQRVPGRR